MAKRKGCIRPDSTIALNSNIKRQRIDIEKKQKKDDSKWMGSIKFQFSYRTEQNRRKAKAERKKNDCVRVRLLFVCTHIKPTTQSKLVVFTLVLRSHCVYTVYSSRVFESLQVRCLSHVRVIVVGCSLTSAFLCLLLFFFSFIPFLCMFISLVNIWKCLNLIQLLSCTLFITTHIKNKTKEKNNWYREQQLKANNTNNCNDTNKTAIFP